MGGHGAILWSAPGHALGQWESFCFQVRTGELTIAALEALDMMGRLLRAQRSGRIGILSVLSAKAPPATGAVAVKQRELLAAVLSDERLFACAVIEGDDLGAVTQRTLLRALLGSKRRAIRGNVADGLLWLSEMTGADYDVTELTRYVDTLRAAADT